MSLATRHGLLCTTKAIGLVPQDAGSRTHTDTAGRNKSEATNRIVTALNYSASKFDLPQ